MPDPAARVGDLHECPFKPLPHIGGPILPPCYLTVLIGGQPAARLGDYCRCLFGPNAMITRGSFKVLIGGKPAARRNDLTAHGGKIVMGYPKVLIG